MPFQKNPKLTLLMLQTFIKDAKERDAKADSSDLKDMERDAKADLSDLENTLHDMDNLISEINCWEGTFMVEFRDWEEIFKNGDVKLLTEKIKSIKEAITINKSGSESSKLKSESDKDQKKTSVEWSQLSVEEGVSTNPAMSNLEASFDYLDSSQLKLCLLCLSVFPEKYVIKKRPLIYWWIGEGLVTKTDRKTAEEVGEDVFEQLIKQGLIEPYPPTPKTQEEGFQQKVPFHNCG
uniref:Disease resistance protein winged helix domain-containing protein n=1 Tax=Davidia involucrata TaxID=16924 RepID=A0A5B6YR35_DAVIN